MRIYLYLYKLIWEQVESSLYFGESPLPQANLMAPSRLYDSRAMLGIRAPNAGPCAIKAQGLKAQREGLKAQRFPEGLERGT